VTEASDRFERIEHRWRPGRQSAQPDVENRPGRRFDRQIYRRGESAANATKMTKYDALFAPCVDTFRASLLSRISLRRARRWSERGAAAPTTNPEPRMEPRLPPSPDAIVAASSCRSRGLTTASIGMVGSDASHGVFELVDLVAEMIARLRIDNGDGGRDRKTCGLPD